jgi:hypothetical protein
MSGRKGLSGLGRAVLLLADIMLVLQAMVIVFNREGPLRTAEWGVVVVSMALAATVGCLAWVDDDKTR